MNPHIGPMRQIAYVVPSLVEAMTRWHARSNVGPFFVIPHVELEVTYRGSPRQPLEISMGLAQLGNVMLELIEQHNPGPSVYRDVYNRHQGGFHHLGYLTEDFDAALAAYEMANVEIGMSLVFNDHPVVYFDTREECGGMTELLRADAERVELFDFVADSVRDWDGTHPVRTL